MPLDMSSPLPLVSHSAPDSIVAWHKNMPITRQQFLNDVSQLAAQLLPGRHMLNVCSDRYHFSVGLAAAITTGKVSLLPSTYTADIASQLKAFAPDVFCLTDNDSCNMEMPLLHYPDLAIQSASIKVPDINHDQLIAIVFTSGSTGEPQPHHKLWGTLVQCVKMEAKRVGLLGNIAPTTIVGTVPPQHMYGFESTVLMPWQSGHAFSSAHPFYPADICQALSDTPEPRLLISTPVHLRALLDSELSIPEISNILSATAPLSTELATEIETICNAPLTEIYGCTETGQIATRRSTQTTEWHLFDDIKLSLKDDNIYANGGHITTATKLNDKIEPVSDEYFLLLGRLTDMINIAGKRHSLASLNHLLTTIPGVIDGAFYMPEECKVTHIARLAAFVVKDAGINATQILSKLRNQIDPVFLPRPLVFVDKLPRNSTGKLPQAALKELYIKNYKAEE
jgi:acyl-coenzyme A synthetase/AMP-(fatty) acid ligase